MLTQTITKVSCRQCPTPIMEWDEDVLVVGVKHFKEWHESRFILADLLRLHRPGSFPAALATTLACS